ncbi:hypothetical protein T01_6827 [Trichinella spiralis]|uniref:Uncharacterized protein n=1 Tax=Trichinella spiralis TaxID=6334 RepID=A0A0V0XDH5_TRISP|nr:hypothetical protein T01_6827 [Trichinella spiralis]
MDCCQKIHIDEGLAITLPQSILASGKFWVAESWDVRFSFGYQRSEF